MTVSRTAICPRSLPTTHYPAAFLAAILLLLTTAFAPRLSAQSTTTAARPSEIAVTGGFIYGNPDYGPDHMKGGSIGGMFTRYFHFPVAPSIEARYNVASTKYNSEKTFVGGLRVQGDVYRHFHPYGDLLVGTGTIDFKFPVTPYKSDNSTIYSFGGGVGVDVIHNLQLTGDYQFQSWNLGTQHSGPLAKFSPKLFTIGVKYVIPFKSYVGSSGHHKDK